MIKAIATFILALNGNVSKTQLAAGIAWGVLLGLIPAGNFFWIVLFLVSFFFRHSHLSKLLVMIVVMIISPALGMPIDWLGWKILHIGALHDTFTSLYNMPFVPFTKFYNTLVMGGLVGGILLWIPIYALFIFLIPLLRNTVGVKLANSKFVKTLVKLPFFSAINKAMKKGV